jgi:hypothetical protein
MAIYFSDDVVPAMPVDLFFTPSSNELLLRGLPNYYNYDDFIIPHIGESIYNKWYQLDDYSKRNISDSIIELYPNNWRFDIDSFTYPDSFTQYLLVDYPYILNNTNRLSRDDITFLYLLDRGLSSKLKKEVNKQCEKTKISKLTEKLWDEFKNKIKSNQSKLKDKDIENFITDFSQYEDEESKIKKIYKLLFKCYEERNDSHKKFDITDLLTFFDGCNMDDLGEAMDEYARNKKYLFNKKYLDKKILKK